MVTQVTLLLVAVGESSVQLGICKPPSVRQSVSRVLSCPVLRRAGDLRVACRGLCS